MKKRKLFILILTLAFFMPSVANASSFNVSISCTSVRVGETSTCTIKGNTDSPAGAGGIKGNISVSGNATIEGNPTPLGWTPLDNSVSSFSYLANSGMTGSFNIATIKLKGNSVGKATVTLSNLIMTDRADYSEKSIGTKQTTFLINAQPTSTQKPTTVKPTTKPTTRRPNVVTSPNGTTTTRAEITVPTLEPLKLTSVTVDNFEVTYNNGVYYATTENFTESVTIGATSTEGVTIIGTGLRALSPGKNVVELVLRNISTGQTNTYQVVITRPDDTANHDTRLTNLKVVDYEFAFSPDTYEYTIKVPYDVKELYVIGETLNDDVNIAGVGLKTLSKGKNKIYIKVSYGSSDSTDYVINVKRSYTSVIMIILSIILGIGLVGAICYAYINRKAAIASRIDNQNRDRAEINRQASASSQNVQVNGQNIVGSGRKTVIPTKVINVKTPSVQEGAGITKKVITQNINPNVQVVRTNPEGYENKMVIDDLEHKE